MTSINCILHFLLLGRQLPRCYLSEQWIAPYLMTRILFCVDFWISSHSSDQSFKLSCADFIEVCSVLPSVSRTRHGKAAWSFCSSIPFPSPAFSSIGFEETMQKMVHNFVWCRSFTFPVWQIFCDFCGHFSDWRPWLVSTPTFCLRRWTSR